MFMNKNKISSRGGKSLTWGGKWGWRGREVGLKGEGSGVKGGGKWGFGTPCPPPHHECEGGIEKSVPRITDWPHHTGKCIRRFGGIYAHCRYFIDRKW